MLHSANLRWDTERKERSGGPRMPMRTGLIANLVQAWKRLDAEGALYNYERSIRMVTAQAVMLGFLFSGPFSTSAVAY